MNILIVDDYPEIKVRQAIQYLEQEKLDFTYTIVKSYRGAAKYLANHIDEIDLAIIDLGLPIFDDGRRCNELEGLNVISLMYRSNVNVPVIINSTTAIPDEEEYLKQYTDEGANIHHVKTLYGEWLYEFINKL